MLSPIQCNYNDNLPLNDHNNLIKFSLPFPQPPPLSFQVMSHDEFLKRINKTLYFGNEILSNDFDDDDYDSDMVEVPLEMTKPLAEYASELFSDTHRGYTLNRLSCLDASKVQSATPATLIMALIYLDRLNVTDPGYVRRITPQELFIVSMVCLLNLDYCKITPVDLCV